MLNASHIQSNTVLYVSKDAPLLATERAIERRYRAVGSIKPSPDFLRLSMLFFYLCLITYAVREWPVA